MAEVGRQACWVYVENGRYIKEFLYNETTISRCSIFYLDATETVGTFFVRHLQGDCLTVTVDSLVEHTDGVS